VEAELRNVGLPTEKIPTWEALASEPDGIEQEYLDAPAGLFLAAGPRFPQGTVRVLRCCNALRSRPRHAQERERGFASMSIDVHYQTLEETFEAHIGRALRGGASPEDLRAVLRFNAQFGVTRAWRGWKALNTYLAQLETTD
jgi:alkylhydroperoxidase/carboxymuconolactone decarboxylase family protein YurZ